MDLGRRQRIALGIVAACIVVATTAYSGGTPHPTTGDAGDSPPSGFFVTSKNGDESLRATCEEKEGERNAVTCSFEDLHFLAPDLAKIDKEAKEFQDAVKQATPEPTPPAWLDVKTRKALEARVADPNTGPKTKAYLKQFLTGDPQAIMTANDNIRRRTCGIWANTFTLDFKKIGRGKWYSDPGPGGLCRTVSVYELTAEPEEEKTNFRVLWTLSQRVVAAGNTEGAICGAIYPAHVGDVETFTWKHPDEFELPCDFIKW